MPPYRPPRRSPNQAAIDAARRRAGQQNQGYGDDAMRRAAAAVSNATGRPATQAEASRAIAGSVAGMTRPANSGPRPSGSSNLGRGGSGGGRISSYGGGGGRGGGGGGPSISQARLDQIMAMLRNGAPAAAARVDLPDYVAPTRAAFNDKTYSDLEKQWEAGYRQDAATQQKAGADLMAFLGSQKNAYTSGQNTYATAGQAPGQGIDQLQALVTGQGVDPSILAAAYGERVGADQAFANMWRSNAAATDTAMQGNKARAATDIQNWGNGLNAQRRAGMGQIGMARNQARSRYDEQSHEYAREDAARAQETAMEEAMANWQRQNQVGDAGNAYRNSVIETLLGLLPQMGNVPLPNLDGMFGPR